MHHRCGTLVAPGAPLSGDATTEAASPSSSSSSPEPGDPGDPVAAWGGSPYGYHLGHPPLSSSSPSSPSARHAAQRTPKPMLRVGGRLIDSPTFSTSAPSSPIPKSPRSPARSTGSARGAGSVSGGGYAGVSIALTERGAHAVTSPRFLSAATSALADASVGRMFPAAARLGFDLNQFDAARLRERLAEPRTAAPMSRAAVAALVAQQSPPPSPGSASPHYRAPPPSPGRALRPFASGRPAVARSTVRANARAYHDPNRVQHLAVSPPHA